jgi:ABC-type oligopeptide transport system ATPase subunit
MHIVFVGESGNGKSTLSNLVIESDGKTFKRSANAKSETTFCTTVKGSNGRTATDTPGLADTEGRTTQFLDDIIKHCKANPPTQLAIVCGGSVRLTPSVKKSLYLLKHCFMESVHCDRPSLCVAHFALIINKMPVQDDFYGDGNSTDVPRENAAEITQIFGIEDFRVVELPTGIREASRKFGPFLKSCDLVTGTVDTKNWRTFTQVLDEAKRYNRNQVSADEAAQHKIAQIRADIQWHDNRIRDMGISIASTGWIPLFGQVATVGFAAAIIHSQDQNVILKKQLNHVVANKETVLKKAKKRSKELLAQVEDLKRSMRLDLL